MKEPLVFVAVLNIHTQLNRVEQENAWKYTSSPLMFSLFFSQLQYTLKCLGSFIGTHIGSQCITYECSIKDKSAIGVVLGLNRVEQSKYTSSPLYGLLFLQLLYTFKSLKPFIGKHIGSQGITYECSIKDKSLIGVVLGLNRVEQWKFTSSPLYGLFFSLLQYTLKYLEPFVGLNTEDLWQIHV